MSFSSLVKNELCRLEISKTCCMFSELAAAIRINGSFKHFKYGPGIRIVTENAAFARRLYSNIKKTCDITPQVIIRHSRKLKKHISYILVITMSGEYRKLFEQIGVGYRNAEGEDETGLEIFPFPARKEMGACCRRSYLRGAFLAGGSLSDPEKTYHLEITGKTRTICTEVLELMRGFNLNSRLIKRKDNYVTYLKEGENIVDFLNIIGAHSALMDLENIRILKEMRNNVNRVVNCETANLEKTVKASVRQVDNIQYIRDRIGFDHLPDSLREIAELRMAYSEVSLKELGDMMNPPLGKSGVNHRLRKLDEMAESLRDSDERRRNPEDTEEMR